MVGSYCEWLWGPLEHYRRTIGEYFLRTWKAGATDTWRNGPRNPRSHVRKRRKGQHEDVPFPAALRFCPSPPIRFAHSWMSGPHPWSSECPFRWAMEIVDLVLYPSVRRSSKFLIQKSSWIGSPANYNRGLSCSQSNRKLGHQILGREGVELKVTTD